MKKTGLKELSNNLRTLKEGNRIDYEGLNFINPSNNDDEGNYSAVSTGQDYTLVLHFSTNLSNNIKRSGEKIEITEHIIDDSFLEFKHSIY